MTEVMLDLETLDTSSNSVIATIGAVKFDRNTDLASSLTDCDTFYRRVDVESCLKLGLTKSEETLRWWSQQSELARIEAFESKDRVPLDQALMEFRDWFRPSIKIWSHGDDFDCVILKNAYDKCNIKLPWKFWNTRDTRTLFDVSNYKYVPGKNQHHALHDAYNQTVAVQKNLNLIKNLCNI